MTCSEDDWYRSISSGCSLSADAERQLLEDGFVVVSDAVPRERLEELSGAYDAAVASGVAPDLRVGTETTRLHGLVNCGRAFEDVYLHPALLAACCRVIEQPFKLSSLLARTLRARSGEQALHVDAQADCDGWPMVGFILMVDAFVAKNGATRFVPGSHRAHGGPRQAEGVCTLGSAGSMVIYTNWSAWHGHSANRTGCSEAFGSGSIRPAPRRAAGYRLPTRDRGALRGAGEIPVGRWRVRRATLPNKGMKLTGAECEGRCSLSPVSADMKECDAESGPVLRAVRARARRRLLSPIQNRRCGVVVSGTSPRWRRSST